MPNFFSKLGRDKKRIGTSNFPDKGEKPSQPNASTIVEKRVKEAERVEETDAQLSKKQGKAKEDNGVTSEPTEQPKKPDEVNEVKPEAKKKLGPGTDDQMTDELLSYLYVSQEYTMTQVVHTRHSEYVPNAMPMFIILDEALRLMGTSSHLSKYYANFNPYAAKLGFAFCYYFQIIRSKMNAGVFDGREPSMISRFTKAFPFNTIPIPNILFPYFRTIVATKFSDAKYDWIVPTYGTGNHNLPYQYHINAARYQIAYRNGLEYSCPNIPAMMMILSSFGAETQTSLAPKVLDGVYRAFTTTGALAATTGFNMPNNSFDFADGATDLQAEDAYTVFRTCGASERFKFWNDDAQTARRHMADSSFYGRGKPAVYCTALPAGSTAPQPVYREIDDIESFLFLSKDYNPAFFGYILEQMMIFCRFYKADKTLEEVPTTAGLLTTINCQLRFVTATRNHPVNDEFIYTDRTLDFDHPNQVTWYPSPFDGLAANFTTSRGGITRFDELMAFTFGTNSIPPIQAIQTGALSRNFRSGKFFEEDVEQSIRYRLGDPAVLAIPGYKPMYDGWTSEVLAKYFNPRPN